MLNLKAGHVLTSNQPIDLTQEATPHPSEPQIIDLTTEGSTSSNARVNASSEDTGGSTNANAHVSTSVSESDAIECLFCYDKFENQAMFALPCGHVYCQTCSDGVDGWRMGKGVDNARNDIDEYEHRKDMCPSCNQVVGGSLIAFTGHTCNRCYSGVVKYVGICNVAGRTHSICEDCYVRLSKGSGGYYCYHCKRRAMILGMLRLR